MKKILLFVVVSIFMVGCEHDDCHYRDCYYDYGCCPPPQRYTKIHDIYGYLEAHKSDVPCCDYRNYFSQYFDVYGPVYCNTTNPRVGNMRLERVVEKRIDLDHNYNFIYSYTEFYHPPTGEQYYIVEYYKNW